ncbi:PIG-L family deacetylase [bacterium]|jgi:LmbE family N-acetylglucosaminyl deacetylase|nr:PIG-L family deacetylase [bacterium]
MKILIIASHPDDEVLGCGGIIKKWSKSHQIKVLFLTNGCDTRYDEEMIDALQEQARHAAVILGTRDVLFEKLPNQQLETIPLLEVTQTIEKYLGILKPEIVFTHHPGDLNRDHRVCYEAVLTATRPLPNQCVKSLYTFFVPSATEWGSSPLSIPFLPNFFVDIEDEIEFKIRAMDCYTSETRPAPHPRSSESLKAYAKACGATVGVSYAEPFSLVRSLSSKLL